MTDAVLHRTFAGAPAVSRIARLAALLKRALDRAMIAHRTRHELDALPDDLLRDIGVNRGEVPFIAGALASGRGDPTRDALDRVNWAVAQRRTAAPLLARVVLRRTLVAVIAVLALVIASRAVVAQNAQVERGKYLVTFGGCHDCHTPGYFFGKPDMARFLGGSEVGFEIPGLGVFHGPNLTPDSETGLGKWSIEEIVAAVTMGRRPDGRMLAPIMPWHAFANLTGDDARAIAAFLKSLPPVRNKVPGPFGPSEKPTSFVMKIVPPEGRATGGSAPK